MRHSLQPNGQLLAGFFLAALAAVGVAASAQSPSAQRRARPPKFDPTILRLLGSEAAPWPQDPLPRWMDAALRRKQESSPAVATGERPTRDYAPASSDNVVKGDAFAWSTLTDGATLEDEIKATAQLLQPPLASASAFSSGGYRDARDAFLLLSRLFQIAAEYDGDVRWAEAAAGAAARFAAAGEACTASDAAAYTAAVAAGEALQRLLRSSSLPPGESVSSQVNDLAPLMKRLQSAERDHLSRLLADEQAFRDRDAIAHEAAIVAVLARDAESADFEFGDDETYAEYAQELVDAAKALGAAARRGDYGSAQAAFSAMRQSCDACHADYR